MAGRIEIPWVDRSDELEAILRKRKADWLRRVRADNLALGDGLCLKK